MNQSLPKLKGLRTVKMGGRRVTLPLPPKIPSKPVEHITVGLPHASQWDRILIDELLRFNPYWRPQTQLGHRGDLGSTSPDAQNDVLRVVIYLQTPIHRLFHLAAHDRIVQFQWLALGYQVVQFPGEYVETLDELRHMIPLWYRKFVEGLGSY